MIPIVNSTMKYTLWLYMKSSTPVEEFFFWFQVTEQLGRLSQLAPRQSTRNENVNISPDNGKYTENGTTTTTVIKIYTMIPW